MTIAEILLGRSLEQSEMGQGYLTLSRDEAQALLHESDDWRLTEYPAGESGWNRWHFFSRRLGTIWLDHSRGVFVWYVSESVEG